MFNRAVKSWIFIFCIFIFGCSSPAKEMQRVLSPDGQIEAILIARETGATVATPFELYVVPAGQDWSGYSPLMKGDKFDEINIVWQQPKLVEIRYKKGRIFSFANFWSSSKVQDHKYVVELRLIPSDLKSLD